MKIAKIVMFAFIGVLVFLVIMLFKSDDSSGMEHKYIIQNYSTEAKGRTDDETYADEVKALIKMQEAKDQQSQQEIRELRKQLTSVTNYIDRQQSQIKRDTEDRIKVLNKMLDDTKNSLHRLTSEQLQEREILQQKIDDLINGRITYDEFNEDAIVKKVLAGLTEATGIEFIFPEDKSNNAVKDTRTAIQKISEKDDDKSNDTRTAIQKISETPKDKTELPKFVPKVQNLKQDNPTGRVKLTPYGTSDTGIGGLGFPDLNFFNTSNKKTGSSPFVSPELNKPEELKPIPVYTIPNTATLVINTLMTPLIGKVPDHQNNLSDPFRFKFITGSENLATNGLRIPGIQNIVWTGFAVGVRDQSCVRAYVDTVTFTFEDGRINTYEKGSRGGTGNTSAENSIGYLTDQWGKSCIRGQYISNATDYLKDQAFAAFIAGIADATADSQIEMVQNDQGDWKGFMTGNTGQYIAGKGVSGTAKALSDFVAKRAVGAFDIIYIEPGLNVQVFVESEIPIDYDPEGRKISYDYSGTTGQLNYHELD